MAGPLMNQAAEKQRHLDQQQDMPELQDKEDQHQVVAAKKANLLSQHISATQQPYQK